MGENRVLTVRAKARKDFEEEGVKVGEVPTGRNQKKRGVPVVAGRLKLHHPKSDRGALRPES